MVKKVAESQETAGIPASDQSAEFKRRFGNVGASKKKVESPLGFLSDDGSASGIKDEDELKAMSEVARSLFNFPVDRIYSWSRWRKWEIPKIAATLVRAIANSPNRPKNPDGTLKRLSILYIEITGWLRLAEEGAMRTEAMGALRPPTSDGMSSGADKWSDNG